MGDGQRSIRELIVMYGEGYDVIIASLDGITEVELDTAEAPGEWTPRQVVHHLGDSELISAGNARKIAAHDNPLISGYDHELLAEKLWVGVPVETSLDAFRGARVGTMPLLLSLSETDFQRTFHNPEGETYTLYDWLTWYGPHAHGHADQIRRARAKARG
ncbi:MAG: DinB family protein [Chloroflexota bacterium]